MTYPESDLVPLSALQHYLVCPRQYARIVAGWIWVENVSRGRCLECLTEKSQPESSRPTAATGS